MYSPCRCFLILLTSLLFLTPEAVAQAVPTGGPMDDTLSTKKADYFALLKANNIDSDRQGIDRFFDNYYFFRWTPPTATGSVRAYSQELLQDLKEVTGVAAREYLLNKSFDTLRKMAADATVTSVARYNAIYTIGQLNQREAQGTSTPPAPYAQALPYLVNEFDKKGDTPDYLRLGALLGIQRFASLGIADAEMKDTTVPAALTKVIQEGKPVQNRDVGEQEILDYFRYRAIETLGVLKSTGSRGEIVDLLLDVMENSQETPDLRCFAARTLADMNFQAANTAGVQINYQRVGTVLLSLGKAIGDIELRRVEDARNKEKAQSGIGPLQPGAADVDPDFAQLSADAQQEVSNAVQRIKTEFFDMMNGIRGPRSAGATTIGVLPMLASDDPVAKKLNDMTKAINQLFDYLDKGPANKPAPVVQPLGDMMGSEGLPPRAAGPKPNAPAFKVNLGLIRDKLQEFSANIDKIIAE